MAGHWLHVAWCWQALSPGTAGSPALTCALPRRATPSWCSGGRSCGTPSARPSSCCSECHACRTSPARPWWSSAKCRSSSAPPTGSDRAPSSPPPTPPLIYWVGFPRAPAPRHPWARHCGDAPCHIQPCAQAPPGRAWRGLSRQQGAGAGHVARSPASPRSSATCPAEMKVAPCPSPRLLLCPQPGACFTTAMCAKQGGRLPPPSTQVKTCPFPSPQAFALAPFVPVLWVPSP